MYENSVSKVIRGPPSPSVVNSVIKALKPSLQPGDN